MLAIGIIAVLTVIYVLIAPKEPPREDEAYYAMEDNAVRYQNNRFNAMQCR